MDDWTAVRVVVVSSASLVSSILIVYSVGTFEGRISSSLDETVETPRWLLSTHIKVKYSCYAFCMGHVAVAGWCVLH